LSSLESDYIGYVGHASDLAQAAQIVKTLVWLCRLIWSLEILYS